jgi:hypothetical protein
VNALEIPLPAFFLQSIPECLGTAVLVISLGYGRLYWKPALSIGLIQAALVYMIRLLPLTFGIHTIVLILTLAVLSTVIGRIEPRRSMIFANAAILLLAISELIFFFLFTHFGIFNFYEMQNNVLIRIIAGTPQVLFLFLAAYVYRKREDICRLISNAKKNMGKEG